MINPKPLLVLITFSCLGIMAFSCASVKSGLQGDTYYVHSKVDLNGQTMTLPENGKIVFERKGSIKNGTLIGKNTAIIGLKKNAFENIHIVGDWRVPEIRSDFFKDIHKDNALKEMFALASGDFSNRMYIKSGEYWVTATSDNKFALVIPSNTTLKNEGVIRMRGNNLISYAVVATSGHDVRIEGGIYYGERNQHSGSTGEWGHGIRITEGASNVTVSGVRVLDCWGDGIAVDGNVVNKNVLIENFNITNCRRQGISVIFAKDCVIRNGVITNIQGTEPHLGIDIEPNANGYCENIIVEDVKIESEKGIGVFTALKEHQTRNVTIKKCKVTTTGYAPFYASRCDGLFLLGNDFSTTVSGQNHVIVINTAVRNCVIENNKIKHFSNDKGHYCIFSSGENVKISNNELFSNAGVAFYTSNALVEDNVVNVPELMIRAVNAGGNMFRRNKITGGIQSIAPDNHFIDNEVDGEVFVQGERNEYKNSIKRK